MTVKLAVVEGAAILAAAAGTLLLVPPAPHGVPSPASVGVAVAACCIIGFYYSGLYDLRFVRSFSSFIQCLPVGIGIALALAVVLGAWVPRLRVPPPGYVPVLLTVTGILILIRAVLYHFMPSVSFGERILVLGTCPLAEKLVAEIEARPHLRYVVAGIVDDAPAVPTPVSPLSRYLHLGPLSDLDRIIRHVRPDRIVVTPGARRSRLPVEPLLEHRVRGIAVEDGIDAYEKVTGKIAIESLAPKSLIFGLGFRRSRFPRAAERVLSLAASAVALTLMAPFLALIAIAIKLDSAGPVFFVQDRVGLAGRRFRFYKFRTMHPAGGGTSEWARDNDDRITRVGKRLRRHRLDELPQFVNVLSGDMNLVGPRPHPVTNFQLFVQHIPYYSLRSVIRPGITGWAQVRYSYANNLEEETEKMRYDLYYIKHLSLWLDLRILLDTVKIVLLGREAVPHVHQHDVGRRDAAAIRPAAEGVALEVAQSLAALLGREMPPPRVAPSAAAGIDAVKGD